MRIEKKLAEPFDPFDIEWRVQRSGDKNNNVWCMVLAYVTNRAIQQRLDDVVGSFGWKNEFLPSPEGGVSCGISLKFKEEWITKYDSAANTNIESVKGGVSGAMKRAGVQWGIGRYLYKLEAVFAECVSKNPNSNEWTKSQTKSKKDFWYRVPTLPSWALPTNYVDLATIEKIEKIVKEAKADIEKIFIAYQVEEIDELSMNDSEKLIKQLTRKIELTKAKK